MVSDKERSDRQGGHANGHPIDYFAITGRALLQHERLNISEVEPPIVFSETRRANEEDMVHSEPKRVAAQQTALSAGQARVLRTGRGRHLFAPTITTYVSSHPQPPSSSTAMLSAIHARAIVRGVRLRGARSARIAR